MRKNVYVIGVILSMWVGLVSCSIKGDILAAFGFSSSEEIGEYSGDGGESSGLPLLQGTILYVSTNGDDNATGLLPSQALRSLSVAMAIASTNHVVSNILIKGGDYVSNRRPGRGRKG